MRALALVACLAAASSARAETPAEAKSLMQDYFDGEKTGGYVLVGMGIAGIATGTFFLKAHCKIRQGMSYPLLAVGTLHVLAGVYIGIASDGRIDDFGKEIDRDGQAWTVRERERMDGVQTQFTVLKLVEVGLIAGGAGLAYYGYKKRHLRLAGAGIGIAIEAAATLLFDIWASRRADDYRDKLGNLEILSPRLRLAF
ncbi:MAG: hypothetical protein M4D80_30650 [Myxococcota bacterium]|nr:hypothetical protein [Myxococcota bacterium]